jgi:hypothetical protein
MSVQATNLYLMHSWELAYAFAGEAVLPLFGLSAGDIDAVLTVDVTTRNRWAATSPALALPRPGLLTARRGNDQPHLRACTTQGHGSAAALTIPRLVQPMNVHLLTAWQQAAGDPALCESFGLTAGELAALKGVDAAILVGWSRLPLAVALPRPGLLPALMAQAEPQLTAFIASLSPPGPAP